MAATPRTSVPPGTRATAADLKAAGAPVESPAERFRDEVLRTIDGLRQKGLNRSDALAALFPRTVLTETTYEDVVTSIVSGAHLLFFGPSGAGKTSLAKELWNLFPKGVWVVEGCPVLDHPLSLVDRAAAARFPPARSAPVGSPRAVTRPGSTRARSTQRRSPLSSSSCAKGSGSPDYRGVPRCSPTT